MSTELSSLDNNSNNIEISLKDLLDKILVYFEKFIKTNSDFENIETKINNYDSIINLIDIIKTVFYKLTQKIDEKLASTILSQNTSRADENYSELEKIVQKYEGEIRTHIRIEQQLKLYAESIQSKYEESEKTRNEMLESTKSMINSLKRDNQTLVEEIKSLKEENEKLTSKVKSFDDMNKQYQSKASNIVYLEEKIKALERILQEVKPTKNNQKEMNTSSINKESILSQKKLNLDYEFNKNHHPKSENWPGSKVNGSIQALSGIKNARKSSLGNPLATSGSFRNNTNNNEYLKVKIEITENNDPQHKDSVSELKNSFHKIYPVKKSKDIRQSSSVMKARERDVRSIYSNPVVYFTNNHSIGSNSLLGSDKIKKRSSSNSSQHKHRQSISKSNFDISSIFNVAQNNDERWMIKNEKKPKVL